MRNFNYQDQKKAIQNFANNFNLIVNEVHFYGDKRKKSKFILTDQNEISISNVYTYYEMNIFLMGMLEIKKLKS